MGESTVALLGTLRELHMAVPGYDLRTLEDLVAAKKPDLLCVEIDREAWESGHLESAPIEGREALAGVSKSSEITLIPMGTGGLDWAGDGVMLPSLGRQARLRAWLCRLLNGTTVGLLKLAGGPRAINSPVVEHLCAVMCDLQVALADQESRRVWMARSQELLDSVLWILRHDPGRRVLVALDCRRKHWMRRRLRSVPGLTVVDFWRF